MNRMFFLKSQNKPMVSLDLTAARQGVQSKITSLLSVFSLVCLAALSQSAVASTCSTNLKPYSAYPVCNNVTPYGSWAVTCGGKKESDGTVEPTGCDAEYNLTTWCCNEKGEAVEQTINLDPSKTGKGHCLIYGEGTSSEPYTTTMFNNNGKLECTFVYN